MTKQMLTAEEIDRMAENGEDLTPYIDMSSITQPNKPEVRRLSLDVPELQVARIDQAAARIGVSRRAAINVALDEWLDRQDESTLRRKAVNA